MIKDYTEKLKTRVIPCQCGKQPLLSKEGYNFKISCCNDIIFPYDQVMLVNIWNQERIKDGYNNVKDGYCLEKWKDKYFLRDKHGVPRGIVGWKEEVLILHYYLVEEML